MNVISHHLQQQQQQQQPQPQQQQQQPIVSSPSSIDVTSSKAGGCLHPLSPTDSGVKGMSTTASPMASSFTPSSDDSSSSSSSADCQMMTGHTKQYLSPGALPAFRGLLERGHHSSDEEGDQDEGIASMSISPVSNTSSMIVKSSAPPSQQHQLSPSTVSSSSSRLHNHDLHPSHQTSSCCIHI